LLIEPAAGRRQQDQLTGLRFSLHGLDTVKDRLRHHHHAGPAAEGAVVDALVLALGPVADVPQVDTDQVFVQRELEKALRQIALEQVREQGKHIEAHEQIRN
jgi:hypothetical protein